MRNFAVLFILFIFNCTINVFPQSTDTIYSIPELNGITVDSARVDTLIQISSKCFRATPQKAIEYSTAAKKLAEEINYTRGVALALKYIGMGYYIQADWINVITAWQQSVIEFQKINDKVGISNMLNNLGAINNNNGDDSRALELFLQSLKISEEIGDTLRIASALINVGLVYMKKPATFKQADEILNRALLLCQAIKYPNGIGTAAVNLGGIYYQKEDYKKALSYYQLTLKTFQDSNSGNIPFALNNVGKAYAMLKQFDLALEHQNKALKIAREMNANMDVVQILNGLAFTYAEMGNTRESIRYYSMAKPLAKDLNLRNELGTAYIGLAESFAKISDFKLAYENQYLFTDIQDTLFKISNEKKIGLIQLNYDIDKKQGEIDLLTKDKELQNLKLERQRMVKNAFLAGLIFILIIAFITFRNYMNKVKTNRLLDKQKLEIESLLMNILPAKVAKELREDGKASSRYFKNVTVLFTDFKDFTKISEGLTPNDLVHELNEFFNAFDGIIENNNLEKIKTIGDSYMCVGGLPSINKTHPVNAINAGLQMQQYMESTNKKRIESGVIPWELRIGIHSGPVTAGVIGTKKYAYDIWGSTVNIASRMESRGEVGKVNISASTFALVNEKFSCIHRGKICAKNMGEIDMYFVESEIKQ